MNIPSQTISVLDENNRRTVFEYKSEELSPNPQDNYYIMVQTPLTEDIIIEFIESSEVLRRLDIPYRFTEPELGRLVIEVHPSVYNVLRQIADRPDSQVISGTSRLIAHAIHELKIIEFEPLNVEEGQVLSIIDETRTIVLYGAPNGKLKVFKMPFGQLTKTNSN
jgi:hypothetical protein